MRHYEALTCALVTNLLNPVLNMRRKWRLFYRRSLSTQGTFSSICLLEVWRIFHVGYSENVWFNTRTHHVGLTNVGLSMLEETTTLQTFVIFIFARMNIRTSFLQQLKQPPNFPVCCVIISCCLVALRTVEIPPFLHRLLVVSFRPSVDPRYVS
jgi:hypothetical protein